MNTTNVSPAEVQGMMNAGAHQLAQVYEVFNLHFPNNYMSELGMTDILMAYAQQSAVDENKAAIWRKSTDESNTGVDFAVQFKIATGQGGHQQDSFNTIYFQAKVLENDNGEYYADFLRQNKGKPYQVELLHKFVEQQNKKGNPSSGYYICYGVKGVAYLDVGKILDFFSLHKNSMEKASELVQNKALWRNLARDTMANASGVKVVKTKI